jgi:hypothetical protein
MPDSQMMVDPLGLVREFRDAASDSRLDGPDEADIRAAAGELAIALGRCRLFGTDPGPDDGTLTYELTRDAAYDLLDRAEEHLSEFLDLRQRRLHRLTADLDEHLFDMLEARMDLWAGSVAVAEGLEAAQRDQPQGAADLEAIVQIMVEAIRKLDLTLLRSQRLLSRIAATPLLENWRGMLAEPYRSQLPWWLDGRLEKIEAARREPNTPSGS